MRDEGEGSEDDVRDKGEGSEDEVRDKGEGSEDKVRDKGESGEDEVRDKGESGEDEGRATWQVFGKIKHHVSLRFFFSKSESLLISSHHSILVSYCHLHFLIPSPLLFHLTSIKTIGLWVDLVSPSNVELWCSTLNVH